MIIELLKRDGTTYEIQANFPSLGMTRGGLEIDLNPIPRTFRDGSVFIGERNAKQNILSFTLELNYDTDIAYRGMLSSLIRELRDTEYIIDDENNVRTKVELKSISETPDASPGTINRASRISIEFIQLCPYWEDETETSIGPNTNSLFTETIDNTGDLPMPVKVTQTIVFNSNQTGQLQIFTNPTAPDPILGCFVSMPVQSADPVSYSLSIDNEIGLAGWCIVGSLVTNINSGIGFGSGFFDLPVGVSDLTVSNTHPDLHSISTVITYRKRYYL